MFSLNSRIKIGAFTFYSVHDVKITKCIKSFIEFADIKVPSKARVKSRKNPNNIKLVDIAQTFHPGDPVTIELGYNGKFNEEFKGFVSHLKEGKPFTIECEGYSWQLKRNKVNGFWKETTLKALLQEAIKGTDIKLDIATDMKLANILVRNGNGSQLISDIIEEMSGRLLTAFFIKPDTLWVGLMYTAYTGDVKYKLGWNVIRHDLRRKDHGNVTVNLFYKSTTGKARSQTKRIGSTEKVIKIAGIQDASALKKFTEVANNKYNNDIFEGKLQTFLIPYSAPGFRALVIGGESDTNGTYIVEGLEVTFGRNGARRRIELGTKISALESSIDINLSEQ